MAYFIYPDHKKCIGKGSYGKVYQTNNPYYVTKVFDSYRDGIHELSCIRLVNLNKVNNNYLKYNSICFQNDEIFYEDFDCNQTLVEEDNLIKSNPEFDYVNINIEKYDYTLSNFNQYLKLNFIHYSTKVMIFGIIKSYDNFYQNFLVHGDIKLENILVRETKTKYLGITDYQFAICDFSLSFLQFADNLQGEFLPSDLKVIQTINYRAPEIMLNYTNLNYKIDIWSLGVVILRILEILIFKVKSTNGQKQCLEQITNYSRFFGKSNLLDFCQKKNLSTQSIPVKNYQSIASGLFEGVDKELVDLLFKMLELDPNNRITLGEIFQHPYFVNTGLNYRFKERNLVTYLDNFFQINQIGKKISVQFNKLEIYLKIYQFLIKNKRSIRILFQSVQLFGFYNCI